MSSGGQFISEAFPAIETELITALERDYSMEDTQGALKRMGSFKSPGPDEYQAVFFKRTWHLIGGAVFSFVENIIEGGEIPMEEDEVLLVPIPK